MITYVRTHQNVRGAFKMLTFITLSSVAICVTTAIL